MKTHFKNKSLFLKRKVTRLSCFLGIFLQALRILTATPAFRFSKFEGAFDDDADR